jgi:hypothetical protein
VHSTEYAHSSYPITCTERLRGLLRSERDIAFKFQVPLVVGVEAGANSADLEPV